MAIGNKSAEDQPAALTPRESPLVSHRSRRRRWFRLAGIVLAILPFVVAEVTLRWFDRGPTVDLSSDPIFDTSAQRPLFSFDRAKGRYHIDSSRYQFFRPASFTAVKPHGARRMFVLGGSTVQGRPYETETAFPKWSELRLKAAMPDVDWEVVNCGGVSYASYRVAIILQEVLRYEPDVIVLYCGHNEFLEERSYNTLSPGEGFLQSVVSRSKLIDAFRRVVKGDNATPGRQNSSAQKLTSDAVTRLDLVDGMRRYNRDPRWRVAVAEHYLQTMRRMIIACQQAGIPLILCVPAADLVATPPFKVTLADGVDANRFAEFWDRATDIALSEPERLEACRRCLELDQDHAGAHFIAGSLHWQAGRSRLAKEHLTAARDTDVCPLRATTPLITGLRKLAQTLDVETIDCPLRFDRQNKLGHRLPDGIPDPSLFVDHVHPSISGHQMIGEDIANRVLQLLNCTADSDAEANYHELAPEQLRSLDETYFNRAKQRLEGLQNWAAGRAGKLSL
ncbi:hypothetical protein [Roseiconus lacunae]|uniref:hypothetical protein n=1 Tax=Roseiconus lacunae TaxID=2605694 RepID=UPI001E3DDD67|nr:hypothetical protein [Roseiconus lacunae]MCD0460465.1 hypothetical protein [Roseiconus lacunae]